MRTIKLSLPEDLAIEADEVGLLSPEKFAALLREEISRLRIEKLFTAADEMASLPGIPLTPEEVEAEIRSQRGIDNAVRP
jgi:hypothetical protein